MYYVVLSSSGQAGHSTNRNVSETKGIWFPSSHLISKPCCSTNRNKNIQMTSLVPNRYKCWCILRNNVHYVKILTI